jgi:hypothetical protein
MKRKSGGIAAFSCSLQIFSEGDVLGILHAFLARRSQEEIHEIHRLFGDCLFVFYSFRFSNNFIFDFFI